MDVQRLVKDTVLAMRSLKGGAEAARLANNYQIPGGYDRIYHWHIRKTAGTSLNRAMLGLGGGDVEALHLALQKSKNKRVFSHGRVFVGHNRYLIQQGRYYYAFSHQPMHVLKLPPRTFMVTVLRDPVKRVLSHYRMLVGLRREGSNAPAATIHGHKAAGTLGHYLDATPQHELLQQLYHFSESLDPSEAAGNIGRLQMVLRTENFAEDVKRLGTALGVELPARHDRRSPEDVPIESDDLERLRELLEPEYVMFRMIQAQRPEFTFQDR